MLIKKRITIQIYLKQYRII